MIRNRNGRAARRRQVEQLRSTIEGLAASHKRATTRAAEAKQYWMASESARHAIQNELERVRDSHGAVLQTARQLVTMVDKWCLAQASPQLRSVRHLHPDARSFQQEQYCRMDLHPASAGAIPDIQSMRQTMHILHTDSSARHHVDRSLHMRVQLADGVVAYGISEYALCDGDFEQIAGRIAEEMAPALLREIRKYAPDQRGRADVGMDVLAGMRNRY